VLSTPPPEDALIRSYLTVALRTIARQSGYALINVIGLAIGMSCAILITCFVYDEYRYAGYHEKGDRLYRVLSISQNDAGVERITTGVLGGFTMAIRDEIPEIEIATRISGSWGVWVTRGETDPPINQGILGVDREAFEAFDMPVVRGDLAALDRPDAVFVTERCARRLFGDEDPVGKRFSAESRFAGGEYQVAGVLKDPERHSMLRYDMVKAKMSYWGVNAEDQRGTPMGWWEEWGPGQGWRPLSCFVLLREGQDPAVVEAKFRDLAERRHGTEYAATERFVLQPYRRIYLHSSVDYDSPIQRTSVPGRQGDIQVVALFSLVALAILLIACVNYVNLATARSTRRAREVGMRKALGAGRGQLVLQFLGESVILATAAVAVAAGVVYYVLPEFNAYVQRNIDLQLGVVQTAGLLLALAVLVGVLGGLYPAFVVASQQPGVALKGQVGGSRKSRIRYALVLTQFAATAVLVVGTLTIYRQLTYLQNKSLGFDASQILSLGLFGADRRLNNSYNEIKAEFLRHPSIEKAAAAHLLPSSRRELQPIRAEGFRDEQWDMRILAVDEDFLDTFGIELLSGRNLSIGKTGDGVEIILNETAVRRLGWVKDPQGPLGKRFGWGGFEDGTVIGVVKDFHIASLREPIEPVFITKWWEKFNTLNLKIRPENVEETIAHCRTLYERYIPNRPFWHEFMDARIERQYGDERRLGTMGLIFSGIAISIACLGLLGLAAFTAEQARKEIGIRRVLGASVGGIFVLLSREFASVVILANLVTFPISFLVLRNWMAGFEYRVGIEPWPFLLSLAGCLVLSIGTVGQQVLRAACTNPVEALQEE